MAVDWRANEAQLRRMVEAGWPMKRIAAAFGTTRGCVGAAIYRRGICYNPEHAEANRLAAIRANAKRPDYRALMAERQKSAQTRNPGLLNLRIRNITSITPEQRRQAGRKQSETRLAHVPPPLRADYRLMIRKSVPAAEALAMLRPAIDAWLRTFEGQLWRVRTGQVRVVDNVKINRPAAYVASPMAGSMS